MLLVIASLFARLFPRAMSQAPCLHEHLANAARVKTSQLAAGFLAFAGNEPSAVQLAAGVGLWQAGSLFEWRDGYVTDPGGGSYLCL